jgi:hypothetical protein
MNPQVYPAIGYDGGPCHNKNSIIPVFKQQGGKNSPGKRIGSMIRNEAKFAAAITVHDVHPGTDIRIFAGPQTVNGEFDLDRELVT